MQTDPTEAARSAAAAASPVRAPEPWFVVQNGQKVSGPLAEATARDEAKRRNGPAQESAGQPGFEAKQAIYG